MEYRPQYQRILLKLSGEALSGDQPFGLDHSACEYIASSIQTLHDLKVQIGVVIGGGNFFRGSLAKSFGFERTSADQIGMIATLINGLALSQSMRKLGIKSKVLSALSFGPFIEPYRWSTTIDYLEQNQVVIFVGGTGNPYFTTDTAAALRASEISAEVLIKATKVDGIYDKDPKKHDQAKMFTKISYEEVLSNNLSVMDGAAIALCRDNKIPVHVVNFYSREALLNAICHKKGGTLVTGE
jgi:uridylate kinase